MSRRTAIVTGSSRGIGKAIALRLAQDGYSVCINDLPTLTAEIQAVVAEINDSVPADCSTPNRPKAIGIPADVTCNKAVEEMVHQTVKKLGPLTLMVANAGIVQVQSLLSVTEADIDRVISINFKGVFNCYTHAARQMIEQGHPQTAAGVGVYKIIGAASVAAIKSAPLLGIYSASKWAVRGLTQAMAMEMAPHRITVNAYAPGIVETAMWDKIDDNLCEIRGRDKGECLQMAVDKSIALKRPGIPQDVARLVGGFLASSDSDYVTGQTMVVDGGMVFT